MVSGVGTVGMSGVMTGVIHGGIAAGAQSSIGVNLKAAGGVIQADFKKTKICSYWQQGMCTKAVCTFAHGTHELGTLLTQATRMPAPGGGFSL